MIIRMKEWQGTKIVLTVKKTNLFKANLRFELKLNGNTCDYHEIDCFKNEQIAGVTLSGRDNKGNNIKIVFKDSTFTDKADVLFNEKKICDFTIGLI